MTIFINIDVYYYLINTHNYSLIVCAKTDIYLKDCIVVNGEKFQCLAMTLILKCPMSILSEPFTLYYTMFRLKLVDPLFLSYGVHRQRHRQAERQADRQTDTHTHTNTDGRTDRQTPTHTQTHADEYSIVAVNTATVIKERTNSHRAHLMILI